jgi:hypothetical protein
MKNRFYLFAILLPIFLFQLPCTFLTLPTGPAKGIKSTKVSSLTLDLNTTPTTIYENSAFTLAATIKNPGSEVASNIKIKAVRESGEFTLDESEKSLNDLEPQKTSSQSWNVNAGKRSGKLSVTLKYNYLTKASGDILIYDWDKVKLSKKLTEEFKASAGILSFEGSNAPVEVSVEDSGPLNYSSTHTKDELKFFVKDKGNGLVTDMKVNVMIKIKDNYCKNKEFVALNPEGSAEIECNIDLQKPSDYKTSIPFQVEVSYTYETSASKEISLVKSA